MVANMNGNIRVAREPTDEASDVRIWRVLEKDQKLGFASIWRRPDGRLLLYVAPQLDMNATQAALDVISADVGRDLHLSQDTSDAERVEMLFKLGLVPVRREGQFLIAVEDALARLGDASLPNDVLAVSARETDADRLRLLDDHLRQEVPGTDGWRWDPEDFREETFGPSFDPALYLVAVDRQSGDYIGLVRVWSNPLSPRIGMFGVLPSHRRRGIVRGLLVRIFTTLRERGVGEVVAEADVTNTASTSLLALMGARKVGEVVELMKPAPKS